ncbi:type II toxin-antitoxin system VapC family toxin [Anthocerotibacter panamensis]|uniref:type II toxin-antitoxin system VapC family toxin n=1 Tax=Anthocerotibacter panamensis TaxID=2857077 RepID=UPI001C40494B|nr:type II toxin-antitoxin system VapC family toxin [Anthocerotibacter panamensis]
MEDIRYLLDTNIVSDLIKHPAGRVVQHIKTKGEDTLAISIVVACELRFGAAKKNVPILSTKIEQLLSSLKIFPLTVDADRYYADLRVYLENNGTPIGPNDMLIASHALALDLILVTANIREFSRIPRLKVENWLEP